MSRPQLVYFVKPVGMEGPIKIGCSTWPEGRILSLATWSPFPLELIGAVPGNYRDEAFLHRCFADLHTHREWFRTSPALREAIEAAIAAGGVDVLRARLAPKGNIRGYAVKRPRSAEQKLCASYSHRVRHPAK
jgi:hypothetical protein